MPTKAGVEIISLTDSDEEESNPVAANVSRAGGQNNQPIAQSQPVGHIAQKRPREADIFNMGSVTEQPSYLLEEQLALANATTANSHEGVDLQSLYLPKHEKNVTSPQVPVSMRTPNSKALVTSVTGFASEADTLTAITESGLMGQIKKRMWQEERQRRQQLQEEHGQTAPAFQLASNISQSSNPTLGRHASLSEPGNIFGSIPMAAPSLFASDGSIVPTAANSASQFHSALQRRSFNITDGLQGPHGIVNPYLASGGGRAAQPTNLRELLNGQSRPRILSTDVQAAMRRLKDKGVKWLRHVDGRIADRRSVFEACVAYHPNLTLNDVNDFVLVISSMPDIAQGLPITAGMTAASTSSYVGDDGDGRGNPFGLGSGFVKTYGEAAHPAMYAYVLPSTQQRQTTDTRDDSSIFSPGRRLGGSVHHLLPPTEGYDDNGEAGAGTRILGVCKRMNLEGWVAVVVRWYGGILLGPTRFNHIMNATTAAVRTAKSQLETLS